MAVNLQLATYSNKQVYAYVSSKNPDTVNIVKRSRAWEDDFNSLNSLAFMERTVSVIVHESLHVVIGRITDFKTSVRLDRIHGKVYDKDRCSHGLYGLGLTPIA